MSRKDRALMVLEFIVDILGFVIFVFPLFSKKNTKKKTKQ
jgi:hypothetical protein